MKSKAILFLSLFLILACSKTGHQRIATNSIYNDHVSENNNPPKVILIIGDGMGLEQISAFTFSNRQLNSFERFHTIGFHKTSSSDDLITDSAASATAIACGIKTKNKYLGVDSSGQGMETILEKASRKGIATGMVVSSTIVHATPAAFVSHINNRDSYEAIAADLLDSGCDVLIGGGQRYFTRRKTDSLNLESELVKRGYTVTDFFQRDPDHFTFNSLQKLVFFTADGDPLPATAGRTYMSHCSTEMLDMLSRKNSGLFAMIEGSQIDWGGHANDLKYVLAEMEDFNQIVNSVMDWAIRDQHTTVIVTADHETGGMSILNGSKRNNLKVNFATTSHTGVLIPVFAYGPGAESFSGIYENTELYHKMSKILFK